MKNNIIRSMQLSFNLPISSRQINHWRGAFIEMAGWKDELLHNHKNNASTEKQVAKEYHYRYPLLQYRTHHGNAAIFAINEGVESLQKVLANTDWKINWQKEQRELQIDDLRMNEHYLRVTNQLYNYKIQNWVALNAKNYQQWQESRGLLQKASILQKSLENHLVGLCLGLGWDWPQPIEAHLEIVHKEKTIHLHGTKLMVFDVAFSSNLLLPHSIAIGKSVSLGLGKVITVKTRKHSNLSNSNIDLNSKNKEMESAKS